MPHPISATTPLLGETVLPAALFKAYDIRGIAGDTLSEDAVYRIAHALGARVLKAGRHTMVVGRDGRLSGPQLGAALMRGLCDSGCKVIDIGAVPTPLVYFALHHLDTGCGVALTGSHNPSDYNGLKIVIDDEALYGDALQQLRAEAGAAISRPKNTAATPQHLDISEAYKRRVGEDITVARPLRVVVDCGNGIAGGIAPALYRSLGLVVSELYCEVDGNFPNHHPDPGCPENLEDLARTVTAEGADLGLAFDGDGDRLGVVGPDGTIVWPDRQMILFARDVLRQHPGARIIHDVKSSQMLTRAIEESGGIPEMWRTGHSLIKARLRQTGAPLAGEFSGHIFFADRWNGVDDAIYAGARLCQILAQATTDTAAIGTLLGSLPNSVNTPTLELPTAEGEQHLLAKKLIDAADFPDARITTIDGLRVDFETGFALIRPSNTTPALILRFEGHDHQSLNAIQKRFKEFILRVQPDLQLPF